MRDERPPFEVVQGDSDESGLAALRFVPDLSVSEAQAKWLNQVGTRVVVRIVFPRARFGDMHPQFGTYLESRLGGRRSRVEHSDDCIAIEFTCVDGEADELIQVGRLGYGVAKSLRLPDESVLWPEFLGSRLE